MNSVHETAVLVDVVADLKRPQSALLDRYFGVEKRFDTEMVIVDLIKGRRTIAPLVSPLVPGRVQERQRHATNAIRPAYIKAKTPFDPATTPVERQPGEAVGGSLSGQERHDRALIRELEAQMAQVVRREELMAAEALRTGKLVLQGEDYPLTSVDFQRDASLTVATLTGTALWSASTTAKPARNFEAWAKLVRQASGANPTDVIMGDDAFSEFIDIASVQDSLDNKGIVGAQMQPGTEVAEGLTFHGVFNRRNIFTYSGWYVDPADDTEKEIWPAKVVAMVAPGEQGVMGRRLYGAIKDPKAGFQALPFFPKMWEDDDPATTWLMTQSAPLVVPQRPDATMSVQVLT